MYLKEENQLRSFKNWHGFRDRPDADGEGTGLSGRDHNTLDTQPIYYTQLSNESRVTAYGYTRKQE